jgi:3-oxoacyl-[acyl-carrier-protein] synthase-1
MTDVFIASDNILSPLGSTTDENFSQLTKNVSGIKQHSNTMISVGPFYASLFDNNTRFKIGNHNRFYTKFEQLLISSIQDALQKIGIEKIDKKTVLIISSTKGNISLLETEKYNLELRKRISLHHSAKLVAEYFHFTNAPLVVSNACISGLVGIITAMRLIQSGLYEHAVVAGADVISKFVLSGFQSFQAISSAPCKPFDKDRDGINLGEGAAAIILSSNKKYANEIKITGGATSNDANHISGPSRTGEELSQVINKVIHDASVSANDINFISAHGTATIYNDEMEAKAFSLANLQGVPVNSLKAYYGHTLGAAGLIESIITIQSMKKNIVLPSKGFQQKGVTTGINICNTLQHVSLKNCLKTASGFGGCNAAVVFSKASHHQPNNY